MKRLRTTTLRICDYKLSLHFPRHHLPLANQSGLVPNTHFHTRKRTSPIRTINTHRRRFVLCNCFTVPDGSSQLNVSLLP